MPKPRNDTVGLTPKYSAATPVAPVSTAKRRALRVEISFLTNGRFLVRDILASVDGSYIMLSAFALLAHSVVPTVRNSNVNGLRLGVSVVLDARSSGTGYIAYEAMAVRVTSTVSLGFERDRRVENVRRKDCEGWAAASAARREDASGGIGTSEAAEAAAFACFNACLRRCGGSSAGDGGIGAVFSVVDEGAADVVEDARGLRLETRASRQFDRSNSRLERKKALGPRAVTAPARGACSPTAEEKGRHRRELQARSLGNPTARGGIRGGRMVTQAVRAWRKMERRDSMPPHRSTRGRDVGMRGSQRGLV